MPTLMSPISVPSPTPTTSTSEITPTAPTVSPAPAAATPATAPAPAPKKSKKSKKKKDKDKEESSDKGADGAVTKSSKKASSKKKKKEEEEARISEAALKRREEIDKKQQQLLLQQQEEQLRRKEEDEDEELRPQQGDQLLLLQQQQLRQAELMPGGIEDGSIVIVRSMRESLNTFPETLEFAPGELCAVLDQVENLGQLAQREEEEVKPAEKVSEKPEKPAKKSKKSRDASSDSAEPAAKKSRKSNNSKENSASANANMFLFSPQMNFPLMPQQHAASDELTSSSRMSIYDFQDDSPPTTAAKQETSKSKSKKGSKSKASTSVPPSTILSSTMNITTSAAMASSTNTLDSLMPVTPQSKSSDSLNTPKPAKAKSKKSDKKSNSTASSSASGGNCNVSSASVSSVSDSLVTTMTSSKSNDSISTSDSVSVILPMPGFDTLESLNSPAPLISPPITSQKSALPENRTPSQTSVQSAETALGQLSSVVSSDVSKSMSVIDSLPDIGDIAAQAGSVETPILQSSQPTLPPVLHHPPQTQNHMDNTSSSSNNSGGSVSQMMQQQQKQSTPPQPSQQKQQQQQPPSAQQQQQQQQQPPQQQSTSTKPHQQASPRQNQLPQPPQIANHTPPVLATPQQGQTQAHPQMGPPTSPAQAVVGRPRSATSHTLQGAAYPATSPQAGGMHTSPSASCISPSSNHSRSSHDGFNQAGGHLAPSPSAAAAARMTDMSSLLGGPDMPCPNANLFAASTPKLSHVQKAQSQGKMCSEDSAASRTRPGIFSADNFVQPSPSSIDPRSQQQPPQQQQQQSSSSDSVAGMGRLPGMNDVTGESFNFTSISLNLTSASSQNAGQEMGIASSAGVPFSFSLTSATTTQTSTSVSNNSHSQAAPPAFPFYTSQPSSTNQLPPQQGPSLSMLNMPDLRMDNHSHQPPPRQQGIGAAGPPMPSSSQNSFNFGGLMEMGGSCSVGRENPSMGRPVDKSPMAGFSQQHSSAGAGGGSSAGGGAGGGGSGQKRLVEIPPPQQANHPAAQQQQQQQQPTQPLDHVPPINRSPQMGSHSSKSSSYFPSPNFPSSANLNTPPLRHPPLPSSESGHLMNRAFDHGFGASQTSNSVPLGGQSFDPRGMPYQKDLNQTRPLEHVSSGTSSSSRKPGSQQQQQQQQQQGGGGKQKQGHSPAGSGGNAMGGVTTHSQSRSMAPSQNASHSSASSQRSASAQPPPPAHQTSGSGHPPAPSPSQQQARSAKRKQASSSSSQSKKKPTYTTEIDANLSHNIFDSNQSFPSLFSFQNMSPPPGRNMQSEGPPFLTSNFFGAPSRPLSNSSNKNTPDLGPPYSVFPPSRQQNGIGINFQHGFGMQAMTGNHGGPMTPHSVAVTPHMSNFSLGNIFPDVNGGAGDSGLNISPIKFPHHGQPILPPPQPGMDPNALQHPHQGSALYHNRGHHGQPHMLPNAMTLNSILGHNHHGFDTRPMTQGINSGVGPPFHGPGHPTSFAMPPLNFSMHEH